MCWFSLGLRALVASLSGTSDAELEKIGANLKEDAHQLDRLVSAIAFDAAAEERTRMIQLSLRCSYHN